MEHRRTDGNRSVSPHRSNVPAGTRNVIISQSGQMPGSLNILSTILRSPYPSLGPGHIRTLGDSVPVSGRGQSPIRVITSQSSSATVSVSPKTGLSPSRTPTTLPPKKSISPSRALYTDTQTPSPKLLKSTELSNVSIGQGQSSLSGQGQSSLSGQGLTQSRQGRLLSHLPYLAQTLQGGLSHDGLFQQYQVQTTVGASVGNVLKESGPAMGLAGRRSPGRPSQPLPAHQRIPTPPHVQTIRRTPSPAHMPVCEESTGKVIVTHTAGMARPQAVNLIKTSAHQSVHEARGLDTDFKYGDLLQSINRSHENIQTQLLQSGLSPITPADPVPSRSWASQPSLADPATTRSWTSQAIPSDPITSRPWTSQSVPQLVPVPSAALSLDHALSTGAFTQGHSIQPATRTSTEPAARVSTVPASRISTVTTLPTPMSATTAVGFTPVVLPSQSYRSRSAHRVSGIQVPTSHAMIPTSSHQSAVSYIHSLGSPAQSISVTQPGPPNVTISTYNSIPSQERPIQKHPRNPFTFPATPPVTLTNERPAIVQSKLTDEKVTPSEKFRPAFGVGIPIVQSKLTDEKVTPSEKFRPAFGVGIPTVQSKLTDEKMAPNEKYRHASDDMPQLSPVKNEEVKKEYEEDLVSIPNAYNMRLQTLANFPNNPTYRPTYRATSVAIHKAKVACITNSAKSLDILRQNLQKCINKEIDVIIQSYLDKYFKIGIDNIRLNNGDNAVTDDHVQTICRQILEEAKKMYVSEGFSQSVSPARELSDNISETGSSGRRSALGRKRHASDTDSEASLRPAGNANKKKKGRYIVNLTGRSTPSKLALLQSKREGPKFEPDRLTEETLFVMGSKANKAMGFGATRGRLYMKHPELFKYGGDQDDKTWLYEHQHMPATGGKSYLIVLDDVRDLALNDEYRDSAGITVESLSGFAVPMWMVEKMRIQMVAMRTDLPKQAKYRSRSTTPNEAIFVPVEVNEQEIQALTVSSLPFASFSSPKHSTDLMQASTAEDELDYLSNHGNSNTPSQMSPFNMTGGFDDTASQSDLDTLDDDPTFAIIK